MHAFISIIYFYFLLNKDLYQIFAYFELLPVINQSFLMSKSSIKKKTKIKFFSSKLIILSTLLKLLKKLTMLKKRLVSFLLKCMFKIALTKLLNF